MLKVQWANPGWAVMDLATGYQKIIPEVLEILIPCRLVDRKSGWLEVDGVLVGDTIHPKGESE